MYVDLRLYLYKEKSFIPVGKKLEYIQFFIYFVFNTVLYNK